MRVSGPSACYAWALLSCTGRPCEGPTKLTRPCVYPFSYGPWVQGGQGGKALAFAGPAERASSQSHASLAPGGCEPRSLSRASTASPTARLVGKEWTTCSSTCGEGRHTRLRRIDQDVGPGVMCGMARRLYCQQNLLQEALHGGDICVGVLLEVSEHSNDSGRTGDAYHCLSATARPCPVLCLPVVAATAASPHGRCL